jgi:hypothetical protein
VPGVIQINSGGKCDFLILVLGVDFGDFLATGEGVCAKTAQEQGWCDNPGKVRKVGKGKSAQKHAENAQKCAEVCKSAHRLSKN